MHELLWGPAPWYVPRQITVNQVLWITVQRKKTILPSTIISKMAKYDNIITLTSTVFLLPIYFWIKNQMGSCIIGLGDHVHYPIASRCDFDASHTFEVSIVLLLKISRCLVKEQS